MKVDFKQLLLESRVALSSDALPDDLRREIEQAIRSADADPPIGVVRSRRILEIILIDLLTNKRCDGIPFQLARLTKIANQHLPQAVIASCHELRLRGNRMLHYSVGYPRMMRVEPDELEATIWKLLQIAEHVYVGGAYTLLERQFGSPFKAMYSRLRGPLTATLVGKEAGGLGLQDLLDIWFRSVAISVPPDAVAVLREYSIRPTLSQNVNEKEKNYLRSLRNAGLIAHDRKWLFAPTTSTRVWPTNAGRLLLMLDEANSPPDAEALLADLAGQLTAITRNESFMRLLDGFKHNHSLNMSADEKPLWRSIRNLGLVRHSSRFLESSDQVELTPLGYYLLGEAAGD